MKKVPPTFRIDDCSDTPCNAVPNDFSSFSHVSFLLNFLLHAVAPFFALVMLIARQIKPSFRVATVQPQPARISGCIAPWAISS
jgi:hypothetical protein